MIEKDEFEKDEMPESRVVIIGGGAAGLSAAIASARLGVSVTLLEADARVGRKILASGNGRCNLSNLSVSPTAFNRPDFVEPILGGHSCEAVRAFFAEMGLLTRADDEGRVYPVTNFAGSVLDVMRLECERLGVEVRCEFEARRLSTGDGAGGLKVRSLDGQIVHADSVVVATGGGSPLLSDVGHEMVERSAVLGPIRTEVEPIRGLSGVRVRCAATLLVGAENKGGGVADDGRDGRDDGDGGRDDGEGGRDRCALATERGELLFRDYGVSGIMVFDLSRYLQDGCVMSIDLFPDTSRDELAVLVSWRCESLGWRTAETFFAGMLHERVARAILRAAGVSLDTPAYKLPQSRLTDLLKDFRLKVVGIGDARQAQVTRGGASVAEFDQKTLASLRVDGLFAAGEVLDVDGRSGGFNLHWAWASGIVAGEAAAHFAARACGGETRSGGPE
jgi:predicted flavoprotein YhiN